MDLLAHRYITFWNKYDLESEVKRLVNGFKGVNNFWAALTHQKAQVWNPIIKMVTRTGWALLYCGKTSLLIKWGYEKESVRKGAFEW